MINAFSISQPFRCVVVGGTGGIGSAICAQFLELGAEVTATGASESEVQACTISDPKFTARVLDISQDEPVKEFAKEFSELHGLINCAGILRRDAEFEIDVFEQVININLLGVMRCCTAFKPSLAAAKGAIVNIASMNSFAALPRLPAYCASKGGVVMLTRSLALAWAGEGIRVNAVAPGFIETPLNAEGRKETEHYNRIAERTALKRWGKPEDVAGTVAYLCMPASQYVTGSVAMVDGGFLAG